MIEHGAEHINSNDGIILVGQLLSKSGLDREVDRMKVGGTVFPDNSNSARLRSYIGVLAEGRTAFEEIEPHRGDALFREALDLPAPCLLRLQCGSVSTTQRRPSTHR